MSIKHITLLFRDGSKETVEATSVDEAMIKCSRNDKYNQYYGFVTGDGSDLVFNASKNWTSTYATRI